MKHYLFAIYSYLNKISCMKTPLHKCRAYEGVSLAFLALESGTSGPTMSRLERGTSNTSGEVCYRVIQRYQSYGLTLEHLVYPERFPDFEINK
ncbi:helix-turn-helix transcriptional regulator [Vibrio vulnificus]|nr:helix-turn-helix transcriptional regulator [Vibrio vulnificus]